MTKLMRREYSLCLSEAIDFFAPVREDFLTGVPPSYMVQG
jgi:hypothetical protein